MYKRQVLEPPLCYRKAHLSIVELPPVGIESARALERCAGPDAVVNIRLVADATNGESYGELWAVCLLQCGGDLSLIHI